jgi:hypothetical protein
MENTWEVELVPGHGFGTDGSKLVARAKMDSTRVIYDVQRIAEEIVEDGSAIDKNTTVGIIHRFLGRCKRILLQGNSVKLDDLVKLWGKVEGNWTGRDTYVEGVHRKVVAVATYADLNDALKDVRVEVVGYKSDADNAQIRDVIDEATQRDDNYITAGDNIIIKGLKIKVEGEVDPLHPNVTEQGIGVFFLPQDGTAPIKATRINHNAATQVNVRVPATLDPGEDYGLAIVTRFSGAQLLKEQRTIIAPFNLTVIDEVEDDPDPELDEDGDTITKTVNKKTTRKKDDDKQAKK